MSVQTERRGIGKKIIPLWVVAIIIVVTLLGSATAMQIYALSIEKVSLFGGQTQSSEFTIMTEQTDFHGMNKIVIKLSIKNTDTVNSHSANVTVYLLDSNSNNIMNISEQTGVVSAGSTISLTFDFVQTGITSQFSSSFIQIKDTS